MVRVNIGIIGLLILFFFTLGCVSGNSVSHQNDKEAKKTENYSNDYWTLEDYLRRTSGIQVYGSGDNIRVTIRGNSSIRSSENQPLYVVNGQKAGRNFSRVSNMFSQGEILSVEVLPAGASSLYGMEGNSGVIKIDSEVDAGKSL